MEALFSIFSLILMIRNCFQLVLHVGNVASPPEQSINNVTPNESAAIQDPTDMACRFLVCLEVQSDCLRRSTGCISSEEGQYQSSFLSFRRTPRFTRKLHVEMMHGQP